MDYNLCSSGKIAYDSIYEVEEALIYSQINFESGATNFYKCDFCECYHLTSNSVLHPLLNEVEIKLRIENERRVNKWKDRY